MMAPISITWIETLSQMPITVAFIEAYYYYYTEFSIDWTFSSSLADFLLLVGPMLDMANSTVSGVIQYWFTECYTHTDRVEDSH